jgi:O-6-methylguanine DNA methyltransferase
MKKSKYVRIRNRPINEQIAHEIDLEVFRDIRKALPPKEELVMELSLHQCVFGPVLIGSDSVGRLVSLEFGQDVDECYRNFINTWGHKGNDYNTSVKVEPRKNMQIVDKVIDSINSGVLDPSVVLNLHEMGTYFQRQVWEGIRQIPPGEVMTYQQLADAIKRPNSTRAIGNACGVNPIGIFIPCHRVVRADGKDVGFKWGLHLKQMLLDRERV